MESILSLFPARVGIFEHGLKYLGYYIKPNNYRVKDWLWILRKLDLRINSWCNRFLTLGGRLTLLSSVLSGIPVYWFSLAQIPVSILDAIRKKMANFLWGHTEMTKKFHLVDWQCIFLPKRFGGWGIRQPYWFNLALSIKVAWRALNVKGLWNTVIVAKYMKGLPLDLWIRYHPEYRQAGSIFWRSALKHMHWIYDRLTWLTGNGNLIRIGLDPIAGFSGNEFRLPDRLVLHLQSNGFSRLSDIRNPTGGTHYWYSSQDLGLTGAAAGQWNDYIHNLQRLGIRLSDSQDTLIWEDAPDGSITARSVYLFLIQCYKLPPVKGWIEGIWKWNIAPKLKCFWWLVLNNAILTWDNLTKRGFSGPSRCVLCSVDIEDINHLFVFCRFTRYIWSCLASMNNFAPTWDELSVGDNFTKWCSLQKYAQHFPIIVCWIIWTTRNRIIFEQHKVSASNIIFQVSQLYSLYPGKNFVKKGPDKRHGHPDHWALNTATFDGASQGGLCGGGGTLTLQDQRIIYYKVGLGAGTNNRAELLSLWALLTLARNLNCHELQVFRDSQIVVDWANGKNVIKNATLFQWYQRLIKLRDTFDKITFEHIYRDYNLAADSLSKEGITMAEGILWYKDASNMEPDGWTTLNIYNTG